MKRILIVGAVAAVVGAAALLAGVGAPEPAQGEEGPATRTVTVTGTGTVAVRPDEASFSFGVRTTGETAQDASDANAEAMRRLIAALKGAGVDEDEIQTEYVSVWPEGEKGGSYAASNSVRVTTTVAQAGALVAVATRAGASSVEGPSLTRSASFDLQEEALGRALANARRKAAALADAAGADLGEVVRLVEGVAAQPYPERYALAASDIASGAPPIEGGRVHQRATLTVTFALQ